LEQAQFIRNIQEAEKNMDNAFAAIKEAAELWNKPALVMLGRGDVPLLEFKEGA
jgi:hypothetical protein